MCEHARTAWQRMPALYTRTYSHQAGDIKYKMPVINEADAVNYGGKVDNNLKTKPHGENRFAVQRTVTPRVENRYPCVENRYAENIL